jgi:hypothetical protein
MEGRGKARGVSTREGKGFVMVTGYMFKEKSRRELY